MNLIKTILKCMRFYQKIVKIRRMDVVKYYTKRLFSKNKNIHCNLKMKWISNCTSNKLRKTCNCKYKVAQSLETLLYYYQPTLLPFKPLKYQLQKLKSHSMVCATRIDFPTRIMIITYLLLYIHHIHWWLYIEFKVVTGPP